MLAEVNGVGPQSPFQQEDEQGQSMRIRGRARPRRIGTTVLFESSGGQGFNLPELRVALGEPEVDTTTIDKRHDSLGGVRVLHTQGRVGRLSHPPSDLEEGRQRRRASMEEETEVTLGCPDCFVV